MIKRFKRRYAIGLALLALVAGLAIGGSQHYALTPTRFLIQSARLVGAPLFSYLYRGDIAYLAQKTSAYQVGTTGPFTEAPALESWQKAADSTPGLTIESFKGPEDHAPAIPFVYESEDAAYLRNLREKFDLDDKIARASDEYDAMLALGAWLGTRWDHGSDPVPGSNLVCDPVAVIEAGQNGAKYWCEIAARTTVLAATALGWPARVITASRDGYVWEHAVAELWSNQFDKWFVLDTDFNVVYESGGVPLSALELSRDGPQLKAAGKLRVRHFARGKPSLPYKDMLPYYRYVHVDLRNDWCSRPLRPGSPVGGDRATWWTARPTLGPILTAKIRVDDPGRFDWPLNEVGVYALGAQRLANGLTRIGIGLHSYTPVFSKFEWRLDQGRWQSSVTGRFSLQVPRGRHELDARLVTTQGWSGPATTVTFSLSD